MEQAVTRAIAAMRENLGQQLTVDDMARAALFSKFHFTRIFQRVTGVSPGRFLSALRLQRAKHLLVSTSLNVAEISARVGYHSVGTFSWRFSRSVGLPPTTYRRMRGFTPHISTAPVQVAECMASARVYGQIPTNRGDGGFVFVGLFPDRIPEGRPARCAIISGPDYHLDHVPPGTWYLLAHSVAANPEELSQDPEAADHSVMVSRHGPLTVRDGCALQVDLRLNPIRALDPPVLLALVDARRLALTAVRAPADPGIAGAAIRRATDAAAGRSAA